jgi:hypothetical protein
MAVNTKMIISSNERGALKSTDAHIDTALSSQMLCINHAFALIGFWYAIAQAAVALAT